MCVCSITHSAIGRVLKLTIHLTAIILIMDKMQLPLTLLYISADKFFRLGDKS